MKNVRVSFKAMKKNTQPCESVWKSIWKNIPKLSLFPYNSTLFLVFSILFIISCATNNNVNCNSPSYIQRQVKVRNNNNGMLERQTLCIEQCKETIGNSRSSEDSKIKIDRIVDFCYCDRSIGGC